MAAYTMGKIIEFNNIKKEISRLKKDFKKIVFTNGCFDIIHAGHVSYLNEAKSLGDVLIVGINSDESVKRLKGQDRPIIGETDRAYILANIKPVDYVVIFNEDTPYNLIKEVSPDFLVKGGDYDGKDIVGKDIVETSGGKVVLIDFVKGKSTSGIIKKIKEG
ncbi:MAG: D-glycero-beta-D-manno-heptose 1-phosphate adenylyltransferase [Candidatus Acidulodesulfobacterium ferriphilum]|jgi:D-beta-D-heptose 7-phosphate kinase/D-beta-D-heptose 1-phosphate adenosyltransferase|uniref:D-glycero-beta-D-manno-heptose 1-phosphate adenylyltransferase n=1 Tax=Candidatus Acidulodesulfobacterium ferriphilum TaxID=2597223 RepID=A0A519BBF0_9DELT|nr:MAG: D-glycero-beta-D-manno-heptose 1-phosphate adenylyltransferase [Candidatus Acidulodesulfobacterium ferriphilum]